MRKIDNNKLLENIKLVLFFLYVLTFYIFGSKVDTVVYTEIILMAFMGLELLTILKTKKIKYCIPILVLFIFVFYCFLSNFWAINPEMSIEKSKTLLLLNIFLLISYNFFISIENGERKLLKILMYAGILFSIYVIAYYGIGEYINKLIDGERIGQEIDNVNSIGQQTAIAVIISIFFGLYENKKFYYLFTIIPLIVALGTGSRKVLIMLVFGTILLFLLKREQKIDMKKFINKILIFGIIAFVFIGISKLPMFSNIFERFEENIEIMKAKGTVYEGTELRAIYIKEGMKQFLETPIFGIGIDNSSYITSKATQHFTYLHNNFVELLATTGITGFCLYYSIYIYIILTCLKNLKYKNKYISINFIIFIIITLEEYAMVTYSNKTTYLYILLGLIVVEKNRKRLKNEKNN